MATSYQRRIARYEAQGATREEARRRAQGTHGRIVDIERIGNRLVIDTKSAQRVRTEIGHAEAAGKRVNVSVKTKSGEWRTLERNVGRNKPGVPAAVMKQLLGTSAGNARAYAARAYAASWADYDSARGELEVDEIEEWQVTIYD